mgnify:CR=1 FL=1
MNISINFLTKIALVLASLLVISAIFITLLGDGGGIIGDQTSENTQDWECVNNNDDPLEECRDRTSLEKTLRGDRIEI